MEVTLHNQLGQLDLLRNHGADIHEECLREPIGDLEQGGPKRGKSKAIDHQCAEVAGTAVRLRRSAHGQLTITSISTIRERVARSVSSIHPYLHFLLFAPFDLPHVCSPPLISRSHRVPDEINRRARYQSVRAGQLRTLQRWAE